MRTYIIINVHDTKSILTMRFTHSMIHLIWFPKRFSNTQCIHSLLEIVGYYNFIKSDVFVLMLDTKHLLDRDISPLVLRMLIYIIYMPQTLRIRWCQIITSRCQVCRPNGGKQGGVLFPILFA